MPKLTRPEVTARLREVGLIPVMRHRSADLVRRAIAAIAEGGVPVAEITMTVPGAVAMIAELAAAAPAGSLIGAGTVLDAHTAVNCIRAGAQFIVSPCLDPDLIARCREHDVVVIPGALTPTEIARAWALGADLVKVFPVDSMGGASYLKALKGPLPHIKLVPTGGVTRETLASFFAAGAEAVGIGSDLVDFSALERDGDAALVARARDVMARVRQAREPEGHG